MEDGVFSTVLVANRGEIAVRVIRTLRRLGMTSVAVYSDADRDAPHVALADTAVRIGPARAVDSYLRIDAVVEAAVRTGAQALHPGYGFLSEHPGLPAACEDAGVVFIGPPAAAIEAMGDKSRARSMMQAAGVPVVPGQDVSDFVSDDLRAAAAKIGFPVIVKPVAGGGGKGMAVVTSADDLIGAVASARRQARAAFGDDRVLLERYLARPRHIEVQVLADSHGTTLHLGERECSLQRRHQKVMEEAPSPLVDSELRAAMGASAVAAAEACGYRGAGTVEYIVSADDPTVFHFLEMNTRLQVEHPVTELVWGLDLVEWQVRIAAGQPLPWSQAQLALSGHAVEARVYAEDPAREFLPTGGRVLAYREPSRPGVRVDSGIVDGSAVPADYDPLLAKVVAHGSDRAMALHLLDRALADTVVLGMQTNIALLRALAQLAPVRAGDLDTGLIERHLDELTSDNVPVDVAVAGAVVSYTASTGCLPVTNGIADVHGVGSRPLAGWRPLAGPRASPPAASRSLFDRLDGWRVGEHAWTTIAFVSAAQTIGVRGVPPGLEVRVDDGPAHPVEATVGEDELRLTWDGVRRHYAWALDAEGALWIGRDGVTWHLRSATHVAATAGSAAQGGPVTAPLPGTVIAVEVADGDRVGAGVTLVVIEAMKMEHRITAPTDGIVTGLAVTAGDQVEIDRVLLQIDDGAAG